MFNSISPAGQTVECGTETSSGKDASGIVTAKDVLVDEHSLLHVLRGEVELIEKLESGCGLNELTKRP